MQHFETRFTLTREYLAECFDESLPHGPRAKPNYFFPLIMLALGVGVLNLTNQPQIAGWALITIGVLELIHIRYRRAWWLARQMWGRSANSEVMLTIDDKGITTNSPFSETFLSWSDLDRIVETNLGYILVNRAGAQQYLSKSILPEETLNALVEQYQV